MPWEQAREGVEVKLLRAGRGALCAGRSSEDRVDKERAMRRRQLKKLWARLGELARMAPRATRFCSSSARPKRNGPWPGGWWRSKSAPKAH